MDCQQWNEIMMRYFDRLLSEAETVALNHHIQQCNRCAEQFDQLDKMLQLLEQAEIGNPPEGFEKDVMSKVFSYTSGCRREAAQKSQAIFVMGIISVLSLPAIVLGTMFLNINLFRMIVDFGCQIGNLASLWTLLAVILSRLDVFLSGLDFLLLKMILATVIFYGSFAIASKTELSKGKMGFYEL